MTYASVESSVESGTPVECFRFTPSVGSPVRYTSSSAEETIAGQVYEPNAISRETTKEGAERREDDFQVTLPTDDPISRLFVGTMPGIRVRLEVFRFHRNDTPTPEVRPIFDGYVQSASFRKQGRETILTCRTVLGTGGDSLPRRTYQAACNHVLYDPLTCKVDDTLSTFRASARTVVSQVGRLLTVSGISPTYADDWFTGGYVEAIGQSDYRLVLDHTGGVLTLLVPFSFAPTVVNVFAGCPHDIQACKARFNNVINYGGFAFGPKVNPFENGIQ